MSVVVSSLGLHRIEPSQVRNHLASLILILLLSASNSNAGTATVTVTRLSDSSIVVLETEATIPGTKVPPIGREHPLVTGAENNTLFLVTATGDLDQSGGSTSWHALIKGSRLWDSSANVSVLTEAMYRYVEPELTNYQDWNLHIFIDNAARLTVEDINNDGTVNYDDILAWDREVNEASYLGTKEELDAITAALVAGEDLSTNISLVFATVEASDKPMRNAVAGDTDARRFDYTINPLPNSVLLDTSNFTVSKISATNKHTAGSIVWYYGQGDTDADGDVEIYLSGWSAVGPDENGLPPKALFEAFEARQEATIHLSTTEMFGRDTTNGTAFIRVADFDEDGLSDVLVMGHNESPWVKTEHVLYRNEGSDVFSASYLTPQFAAHEASLRDFDQDGFTDIIATGAEIDWDFSNDPSATSINKANMLLLNDQNGGFEPWALRFNLPTQNGETIDYGKLLWINAGSGVDAGNLDADPEYEIVISDVGVGFGSIPLSDLLVIDNVRFENTYIYGDVVRLPHPFMESHEEFQAAENEFTKYAPSHDTQIDLFDYDNDGDQDIVVYAMVWTPAGLDSAGIAQFLQNDGNGNFSDVTENVLYNYNTGTQGGHEVCYLDINDDGFLDIISAENGYSEKIPWDWGGWTGDLWRSIARSWGNVVLINTGNGKFVVTLWEGYDDFVQQFYDIYVNDETTNPYMLQNNRAFPYVTKNNRLGFIMKGNTHENWIHFFDIRANEPLYTGPKGINPATRGVPGFSEYYYLTENPNVSELVSAGSYSDGLAHYLAVGQNQGLSAFATNARIHGSTSNDEIRLREGNESAFGYAGDDTFHTGSGNDSVDGGDGNDRVVYEAALSTFRIETDSGVVSVTSNDGSTRDVLSNIEQFVFDTEIFTLTQLDTDGDGLGNNDDADDDGDGFSDEQEALDGTDPLNRFSCNNCFDFDIDVDGDTAALTDGLLVLRHLFGFAGPTLTDDALASSAARVDSETIASYLNANSGNLDIDGDGSTEALTDGLLLLRYLFGFDGPTLIEGAVGENAMRTSATEIRAYIEARISEGT